MTDPWDLGWTQRPALDRVLVQGVNLSVGNHVRLRPRGRADVFDIALAGRAATISRIEQDFEDQVHVVVVIDDDPGRDLGEQGKPGHQFFFRADELEPITADGERTS